MKPSEFAARCNLLDKYEQIVAHYSPPKEGQDVNNMVSIDQLISQIEQQTSASAGLKTLVITDLRCIEHADFPYKRNIKEKVA